MAKVTRRGFIAIGTAAAGARALPGIALKARPARRVLTLVYDKSLGMMRAIERVVH